MILALVVLAIFALLYLFAFDDGMIGSGRTIESVISGQADRIDNLNYDMERYAMDMDRVELLRATAEKVAAAKTENDARDKRIASLRDEAQGAASELTAKIAEFEGYVEEYRTHVRDGAKGRILEELVTMQGKVYKNVDIREVTPVGMEVRHEAGLRRIPFEDLPEEMQDHFQFDSEQKESALSRELAVRTKHEAQVAAAKLEARRDAADKSTGDQDGAKREIAIMESRVRSYTKEIYDLEEELRREGLKTVSNAPQLRRKLDSLRRTRSRFISEVARMKLRL